MFLQGDVYEFRVLSDALFFPLCFIAVASFPGVHVVATSGTNGHL